MMQHTPSVEFATIIHRPHTPTPVSSCASFQTAQSERFHSLSSDDTSSGSESQVLLDDSGSITPTQDSRRFAPSRSLENLSNVRSPEPSHISTAPQTMMGRPRGVSRRKKFESNMFEREPHEPRAAMLALRARSERLIDATEDLQSVRAGTASQATETPHYPPNDLAVNIPGLSSRLTITGTALDGPTGSPRHSATSTRRSWIPVGASSMQNLMKKWRRSQVGTDQQSQSWDSVKSGISVQSGKSKASAWFGRVKRFGRMGRIRDRTVRRTAAMDDFIKSGHELYEGT